MSSGKHEPVKVSLKALREEPESLLPQISKAFGSDPGCLGIIVISDLPSEFAKYRSDLFHLIQRFANLPEEEREKCSRPENRYMFGWSHGKEIMNGRPDTMKGSYYANPLLDTPDVSPEKRKAHPEYYESNVWPHGIEGMEEFEAAFKVLGKLIFEVGITLAKACEPFVSASMSRQTSVASLIGNSKSNKARLLHYFPEASLPSSSGSGFDEETLANDALCGTHIDHSLLTGLCSAMYLDGTTSPPTPVSAPTLTAGLWIYPRHPSGTPRPDAVKVAIPPDCLAFQTGEALQLLTGDRLAATPHFVSGSTRSSSGKDTSQVSRETFAFFLQPDVDDVIGGQDGETFGQFSKRVLGRHYAEEGPKEAED